MLPKVSPGPGPFREAGAKGRAREGDKRGGGNSWGRSGSLTHDPLRRQDTSYHWLEGLGRLGGGWEETKGQQLWTI